jgi:hypothetical protein
VKLVGGAADSVGEEQDVALQPRHLLGRELKADAGSRHDDDDDDAVLLRVGIWEWWMYVMDVRAGSKQECPRQ